MLQVIHPVSFIKLISWLEFTVALSHVVSPLSIILATIRISLLSSTLSHALVINRSFKPIYRELSTLLVTSIVSLPVNSYRFSFHYKRLRGCLLALSCLLSHSWWISSRCCHHYILMLHLHRIRLHHHLVLSHHLLILGHHGLLHLHLVLRHHLLILGHHGLLHLHLCLRSLHHLRLHHLHLRLLRSDHLWLHHILSISSIPTLIAIYEWLSLIDVLISSRFRHNKELNFN